MFPRLIVGTLNVEGGDLHFKREEDAHGIVSAFFSMHISTSTEAGLSFDAVTHELGDYRIAYDSPFPPPPETIVKPTVAPNGNRTIKYQVASHYEPSAA